ncbi:MAG: hypothetical protein E6Q62_02030 [Nitrosomonas sp.]|nr:MAG: hypothetical protein E6Q62_02030 [Nitrosomonas sp.]
MNLVRMMRHFFTGQLAVRRIFPQKSLAHIEQAIMHSESSHEGQICFAVEAALNTMPLLNKQTARDRAVEVFSQLRVWDTANNNGVLIYVLLADRDVEIIADRGIDCKVTHSGWEAICREMEALFRLQQYEAGAIAGINQVGLHLQKHFPAQSNRNINELADKPVIL